MRMSQYQFRTKVSLSPEVNKIKHEDSIFLLGSCFAQNIQSYLDSRKFKTTYSPHGILFDPMSIGNALNQYMDFPTELSDLFVHHSERYFHFQFHSAVNETSKEQLIAKIKNKLREGQSKLKECKHLIISLGTSIVYQIAENEKVVANCHKVDAKLFYKKRLLIESTFAYWKSTIEKLNAFNPDINITLTVSPIRHAKNGFAQNNVSKAVLLLLSHKLAGYFANVKYFPSYELLMDELRDYRFYEQDMLHPSSSAVQYIVDGFGSCYFDQPTLELNKQIIKIKKSLEHKPNYAETADHKNHLRKVKDQIQVFVSNNSHVTFHEELKTIEENLAK